ncbi:hypothetical protein BT96DRAFT_919157 [Gymnopus androsaceus JB14]|uniref:F-box domain-containing protein n=1 Tax=Gymnopus androsaceus JB14 TaxID=1447944 RepID=A0A6A4HRV4_9AGAR|nr:hypothetical protein BT96DRAFT_919157 [Gymnopus androsaceus JB14]
MENGVDVATASVVQRLSNVNDLTFSRIDWNVFSPMLKSQLIEILRSSSLTQFRSRSMPATPIITALAAVLACARHLKIMDVSSECTDWNSPTEITGTAPRSIHLEELKLSRSPSFINSLLQDSCPFEVRNLRLLDIRGYFSYSEIAGLMQYIGGNLKNLKMDLGDYEAEELNGHLEHTPNLRILHLTNLNLSLKRGPVPKIQALFRPLLSEGRNRFPLQHIIIDLNPGDSKVEAHCWSAIDALFEKPEFALLETVEFRLFSWPSVPRDTRRMLEGQLPFLQRSGRLRIPEC